MRPRNILKWEWHLSCLKYLEYIILIFLLPFFMHSNNKKLKKVLLYQPVGKHFYKG